MTTSIAGKGASADCKAFLDTFLPLAAKTADAAAARNVAWKKADTNGEGHLSLSSVEKWIERHLCSTLDNKPGKELYKKFFPAYSRAFNSSRNVPGKESSDYVDEAEFRIFVANLCFYVLAYDAYSAIYGSTEYNDRRDEKLSRTEWLSGGSNVLNHGFVALSGASTKSLKTIFDAMDENRAGTIHFTDWCRYLRKTDRKAGTELGSLLEFDGPISLGADNDDDDDPALRLVWMFEDAPADPSNEVLTAAGLDRIASHKYVPGTYTWLDNLCNPMWTILTEYLPLNMAPNLVTLTGALHCLMAYIWTWYAAPEAIEAVPPYLLIANGYCLFVAYTLDCMDGKQARRTGTSSPLGQLVDHGLDCLCLLAHVGAVQAWIRGGERLGFQVVLQFSFYTAQWEEFYTHILPHATGPIGVTEVNYALALASLLHGTIWKEACTNPEVGMYDGYLSDDVEWLTKRGFLPQRLIDVLISTFMPGEAPTVANLAALLNGWRRKDAILTSWCVIMLFFCSLSAGRVLMHLKKFRHRLTAVLQLFTPLLLIWLAVVNEFDDNFDGNAAAIRTTVRWKSLAIGLLYCHVSIKVIVYSMARQPVAVVQWDVLPLVAAILLTVYDSKLHAAGHILVWRTLSFFWGWRLLSWTTTAMRQISQRLNIRVWTIDPPKLKKK